MRATVAVVLLGLSAEVAPSLTPLPPAVASAMAAVKTSPADKGFKIPSEVPPVQLVRGDLDGNGFEDWAIIVDNPRRTAILVAYGFGSEWRSGNIDVWAGPECANCSQGSRPVSLSLLPPGSHERVAPDGRPLLVNERQRVSSEHPGVRVTLADGGQRAYYLGPHAWVFVDLGLAR